MTHDEAKQVTQFLVNARPLDKMDAVLPSVSRPNVGLTMAPPEHGPHAVAYGDAASTHTCGEGASSTNSDT
ncbi:MAG: hypothetical protein QF681_05075 [Vicinamibacterales bacterium]|jgi:hypothetical protein|nr:hypothetical protein [Vicinamibacterales bacterium]